jgi:hypothetical protein
MARSPRGRNESWAAPARGESRELQKMKNSGNEAKKSLKTKEERWKNEPKRTQNEA